MFVIFFFDSSLILIFLLIAFALGYQAYAALHGIIFILTIIFFAAISILTVIILISKASESTRTKESRPKILWNLFMSTIASVVSLYTCNLFMRDLRIYGDGMWDMIGFIIGLMVGGAIWLFTTAGWIEALDMDHPASFSYKGFLKEMIAAGVFYALVHF